MTDHRHTPTSVDEAPQLFNPGPAAPVDRRHQLLDDLHAAVGDWIAATGTTVTAAHEPARARRRGATDRIRWHANDARRRLDRVWAQVDTELARLAGDA